MNPRAKFLALIGIFLVPTAASFLAFYVFPPSKTINYGSLISPVVALPKFAGQRLDGGPRAAPPELRGKWLIVTRDSGNCGEACEKKLRAMRQARLILGREQDRILRVVLVDDDVQPSESLQRAYEGTLWVSARASPWLVALPPAPGDNSGREAIYAIDTLGNLFMRYPGEPDIKRLANDLQRVLKASQIG